MNMRKFQKAQNIRVVIKLGKNWAEDIYFPVSTLE